MTENGQHRDNITKMEVMQNGDFEKLERIMREEIIQSIKKNKLIVIVRGVKKQQLIPLAHALYEGGIRLLEITYSPNGEVSDEETAQNIHILSEHFQGKMYIGAGTVLNEKQVEMTNKAGGRFVISPDVCPEVIRKTRELNLVSIPGAFTATEMQTAHRNGADFIKVFPITSLGTEYLKSVRAPLSHLKFLAVGGIDENNVVDYLNAGVCGFGIGTNIINKTMISNNDYVGIAALAKKYLAAIKRGEHL